MHKGTRHAPNEGTAYVRKQRLVIRTLVGGTSAICAVAVIGQATAFGDAITDALLDGKNTAVGRPLTDAEDQSQVAGADALSEIGQESFTGPAADIAQIQATVPGKIGALLNV